MQLGWILLTKEENNQKKYRLPIIALVNGILYIIVVWKNGITIKSMLYCLMTTVLLLIALEDEKNKEIPLKWNISLSLIGILICAIDRENIKGHIGGMLGISILLVLLHVLSKGRAIGGGDVKFMCGAGLILEFEKSVYAFWLACILALLCHLIRMKKAGAEHTLAMGPYLAFSVWICTIWRLH